MSHFVVVGSVARPFGIRGEVVVDLLTDFPDRFSAGNRLFVSGAAVTVRHARMTGDRAVVKLEGIDTRTEAERLRGCLFEIPDTEVTPLPPGQYYRFQLLNLPVSTDRGDDLGRVFDLLATGSHDVLVVRGYQGEVLIPATKEITTIDLQQGLITVRAIPGLLDDGGTSGSTDRQVKG